VVVGQVLDISDHLTAAALSIDGSVNVLGTVAVHLADATTCTLNTRFRERRDDREAGEAVTVGPYVHDADGNAVNYTRDEFVGVVGTGTGPFLVTAAAAGATIGTDDGPVSIADAINNQLKVTVGTGDPQTIALATGPALEMVEIQNDINATAVGFTAGVDGGGHLVLTADDTADDLEVVEVTGDCYTALGLTAAVYSAVPAAGGTHTGTVNTVVTVVLNTNDKLKLKVGAGASQTVTLTAGVDVALTTIRDEINTQTDNIVASVAGGYLKLQAYATYDDLEIEAVANDAYTLLGLTVDVYEATSALAGTTTGTATGAQFIADAVNTKVKLKVTGGESETVTLTVGAARTITQIAGEINSGTTGLTAAVNGGGFLTLTADETDGDLWVEDVADDAYAVLGLVVDQYEHTVQANQFKVKINSDGDEQTFTLTSGSRNITQVIADFAAAVGFVASASSGHLRLATEDLADSLIIMEVSGDCYTALGFTADTYDEVRSHNPAAIAGLIIGLPSARSVSGGRRGPYAITNGSNDALSITIGDGEAQVFDLTAGAARTASEVCDDINATATDFMASVVAAKIRITADDRFTDITLDEIAHDAYSTLGLAAGNYAASTAIETLEK